MEQRERKKLEEKIGEERERLKERERKLRKRGKK